VPDTRLHIVTQLQHFLHANNVYFPLFKTALERMSTDYYKVVIRAHKTPTGEYLRRFNAPTLDEVAIVMVGNDFGTRDIVFQKKNNTLQGVAENHRSYSALQYPLIFWQRKMATAFKYRKHVYPPPTLAQGKRLQQWTFMPTEL